jgi:hypothetical protein
MRTALEWAAKLRNGRGQRGKVAAEVNKEREENGLGFCSVGASCRRNGIAIVDA